MGFFIKRTGFTSVDTMARAIVADMVTGGFTLLYPATQSQTTKAYTLKAGPTVDPLSATQPWAIKFQWDKDFAGRTISLGELLDVAVATPAQFSANDHAKYQRYMGSISARPPGTGVTVDVVGIIGTACGREQQPAAGFDAGYRDRIFIDRTGYKEPLEANSYPMSYVLSISSRGFVLDVWEEGHDREGNRHSWIAVQRPVDNVSGQVITTGKAPVHCMYGLAAGANAFPESPSDSSVNNSLYNIRRFVVREADVSAPCPLSPVSKTKYPSAFGSDIYSGVDATKHSVDYNLVINAEQQVAITENNKYVITFPNGLNTARYAYTHEMDMIAYTSADVVSEGTEVPVQVYGESVPRKYTAMTANSYNNTGMRLLILSDGGGVTAAP